MKNNFEKSLKLVLNHEGGFSQDQTDPGGTTNKGITLKTFRSLYPKATVADLKSISEKDVKNIYKKDYWDAIGADKLPIGVDYTVFDFAVNSGVTRALKFYRQAKSAKLEVSEEELIRDICALRRLFLNDLIVANPKLKKYEKGWGRRIAEVYSAALAMRADIKQEQATI